MWQYSRKWQALYTRRKWYAGQTILTMFAVRVQRVDSRESRIGTMGEDRKGRKFPRTKRWRKRRRNKEESTIQDHWSSSGASVYDQRVCIGSECARGVAGELADRQTLNSCGDPDELSVVPIITASLSNLIGHRPNMLQTCSGIPLANTFVDTCASLVAHCSPWEKILMAFEGNARFVCYISLLRFCV